MAEFFTTTELSQEYGFSKQQIWNWARTGILPSPERINKGGKEGWISLYPQEAKDRLNVLKLYEKKTGKQIGKTLKPEGILHLLFACGFSSPEIYEAETNLIKQGAKKLQKLMTNEIPVNGIDQKLFITLFISSLINKNWVDNLKGIFNLIPLVIEEEKQYLIGKGTVRGIMNAGLSSGIIKSIRDYPSEKMLIPEHLIRLQNGIYLMLTAGIGLPHKSLNNEMLLIFQELGLEFQRFLSTALITFLRPEYAGLWWWVYTGLRETDDILQDVKITLTDEEEEQLDKITPPKRDIGYIKKGKPHVKIPG